MSEPYDADAAFAAPGADDDVHDFGYDAAAEAGDDELEAGRPSRSRRSAQDRIDAVTRGWREAERERDYWREQAMAMAEPDHAPGAEPFEDTQAYFDPSDPEHVRALAAEEARAAFAEIAYRAQAEQAEAQAAQAWDARQQDFARLTPDYFDVLHAQAWPCSEAMAEAIRTSDDGAAVAYHLASYPDEARRIARLPQLAQIREIGRLETHLGRGGAPYPTVSQAPRPPAQIRGFGGRYRVAPDTQDFAAFDKAYG